MQVHIYPTPGHIRVGAEETTEWVERCGWVRVQQCVAQTGLADVADRQVLSLIPRVTESHLPVPGFEIVAKFPHLTFQPHVKEVIPVGNLVGSLAGVLNGAEPNARSDRHFFSTWRCPNRVSYRERIKRILDRDTNPTRTTTNANGRTGLLKRIRQERRRSGRGIKKRPRHLEVGKYGQVFVADIPGEGTIDYLAIRRRQQWRHRGKVVGLIVPVSQESRNLHSRDGPRRSVKWRRRYVSGGMRRRGVVAKKKPGTKPQ